jgi:hypothetical protein
MSAAEPLPSDDDLPALLKAGQGLTSAPAHLLARADAIWRPRERTAARPAAAGALRQLWALLRTDSAGQGALALGLRQAAAGSRQMMFSADGVDVDLRITDDQEPGRARLHGQVFASGEGGLVWLAGDAGLQSVAIDAFGEFRTGPLEPGRYRIGVERDDWVVELPPIELPGGRSGAAGDAVADADG